jgi:protein tyrosine/serine phosphatase
MPPQVRWVLAGLLFASLIGGPVGYARYRKANYRNFQVVAAGKLYRSGQLSVSGLDRLRHDYGIKTVVSLRDAKQPDEGPPDAAEETYCGKEEMYYYRLPHRSLARVKSPWLKEDGKAGVDAHVAQFLRIMDDPKHYPVLVHCTAGKHRTGAYIAIYRMEYERWSNAEAIAEIKAQGYDDIDEQNDILDYLQTYQPRWKRTAE